ncbi:peptidase M20, dimerization domain-containing protein [Mycena rebaudengoi]|nr:peptidase M20, dimerization domain-containing protein [Mycena rebaudengoi]
MLLERGAYKGMDFCVMSHPTSGPPNTANIATTTAAQYIDVEFIGRSAHAGEAPWEGTNALDAAFMAYSGISVLRQQMRPDHRVHGVIYGNEDWAPNVIPDNAKMHWMVRAPTSDDLVAFAERVKRCFDGCSRYVLRAETHITAPYSNLIQNPLLLQEFAMYLSEHYRMLSLGIPSGASTDFGNISHALPSLHPMYAIPTPPNGGNHTFGFTKAAASEEAHSATMIITKALAYTSFRVLRSDALFRLVRRAFDEAPGKSQ